MVIRRCRANVSTGIGAASATAAASDAAAAAAAESLRCSLMRFITMSLRLVKSRFGGGRVCFQTDDVSTILVDAADCCRANTLTVAPIHITSSIIPIISRLRREQKSNKPMLLFYAVAYAVAYAECFSSKKTGKKWSIGGASLCNYRNEQKNLLKIFLRENKQLIELLLFILQLLLFLLLLQLSSLPLLLLLKLLILWLHCTTSDTDVAATSAFVIN